MNLVVLGLMALIAGLVLRELATLLRARAPEQTRMVMLGAEAPACQDGIPKILWAYGPASPPSPFIQACLDNWRQHAPDHELRLLDRASLARWLPALRADFDTLPAEHQLDWLRAQLLARHGGIWMDATTLLSRDLAWLHETRRRRAADGVGFYTDRWPTRPEQPIVQSWLMASVAGGRFATALAQALDQALDQGPDALLQRLHAQGRQERVMQGLSGDLQHRTLLPLVASELQDREPQGARLVLLRAEDGPLAWQAALGWRERRFYARLALLPCPRVLPAVLALGLSERAVVERNWRRGLVSPFSALRHLVGRRP